MARPLAVVSVTDFAGGSWWTRRDAPDVKEMHAASTIIMRVGRTRGPFVVMVAREEVLVNVGGMRGKVNWRVLERLDHRTSFRYSVSSPRGRRELIEEKAFLSAWMGRLLCFWCQMPL